MPISYNCSDTKQKVQTIPSLFSLVKHRTKKTSLRVAVIWKRSWIQHKLKAN